MGLVVFLSAFGLESIDLDLFLVVVWVGAVDYLDWWHCVL